MQVAALQDIVKKKDEELGKAREQMLERTKELRDVIDAKDTLGHDVQAITDRALKYGSVPVSAIHSDSCPRRLEELLQAKEKLLRDMSKREERFEDEFRAVRSRADTDHMHAIAALEQEITAIRMEAQSDKIVRSHVTPYAVL